MKKRLIIFLNITLLTASVWASAEAAPKPVQFAKGKSSAASKGAVFFNVMPPKSTYEALFVDSNEGNHYSGKLSSDGEYIIRQ